MKLIFVIAALFYASSAFATDVTSLAAFRAEQPAKQFVGQFLHATPNGGEDVATIVIENGYLQFWTASGGNIPTSSFRIELSQLGVLRRTAEPRYEGWADIEMSSSIEGKTATTLEVITMLRSKSIEHQTLTIEGSKLIYSFKRTYYKRKYIFAGPWIEDTKSFNGTRNARDFTSTLLKLSSVPMPLDIYFEMIRKRPSRYIVMRGSNISADNIHDEIKAGNYDEFTDADLKKKRDAEFAKVVRLDDFRDKGVCKSILEGDAD